MNKLISLLLIISLIAQTEARTYTLFKQCDAQWGSQALGTSGGQTICSAGCLVSSVSMILNTYGTKLDGNVANPSTMNIWLKGHGGYVSGNLYVWGSIGPLGYNFIGFGTNTNAASQFDAGYHVILNVNNGGHYVLMTGYSGSTFNVNDPGYAKTQYISSDIVRTGVYQRVAMVYFENVVKKFL